VTQGPAEQFISEPIVPAPGSFDTRTIARGEPGLPQRFTWRGSEYTVAEVLAVWKTSSPDTTGEVYLRRHWWELRTTTGHVMKLYFERQKNRKNAKARWFVYTVIEPPDAEP
jgi:Domain of unknown function (DUF6504)